VATLAGYDNWYGSAHAADVLTGQGSLAGSTAEAGGAWTALGGAFHRSAEGLTAAPGANAAILNPAETTGLVHLLVKTTDHPLKGVSIVWRARDSDNFWAFEVGTRQCQLAVRENGTWSRFPVTRDWFLAPHAVNSVQVTDDGENIRLYVNGETVYGSVLSDTRLNDATGVGLLVTGDGEVVPVRSFEAHPRSVPIPAELDLGEPWVRAGTRVVAKDDFVGPAADLAGRNTPVGGKTWSRDIGQGVIDLTGQGTAKIRATLKDPCPGRTAYMLPWDNPAFADVSVTITPPGTRRGVREKGRGGLIFWQDERNYITFSVFLDDWYGSSIAAFFYVDGYEELFDAVWTNLGKRVYWGMPYDFRVVFDGNRFLAYVNGEPVLYRSITDIYPDWHHMPINRTGLVVNWEYGNDTGTVFKDFAALDVK
jgi:hypothetical protein